MGNKEEYMQLKLAESRFYTRLLLPQKYCDMMPHVVQTWFRNFIVGILTYAIVTLLCVDFWKRHFTKRSVKIMVSQLKVASTAIPLGLTLHTVMDYLIVNGWTKCYPRISYVGLYAYLAHLLLYMVFLEFATYWAHRLHHDIGLVYNYIHRYHHVYAKEESLTPLTGYATHPLESILMGLPHGLAIMIIPTHFKTHLILLLIQSIWALVIHDRCDSFNYWPLMGAKYHTMHHVSNYNNFGNFTIFVDQLYGTLHIPAFGSKEMKTI